MTIELKTPKQVRRELALWFRQRRVLQDWTQQELSDRSGIALSTLRLFESSGQISLERLLRLASVLGVLDQFSRLCQPSDHLDSLSDLDRMNRKRVVHRKPLP